MDGTLSKAQLLIGAGFEGGLSDFLKAIKEALTFGWLVIDNSSDDQVVEIRMSTGGWSEDEELLDRVRHHSLLASFWVSSHVGGHYVYRIAKDLWVEEPLEWMRAEEDDVIRLKPSTLVHIRIPNASAATFVMGGGAEVIFTEEDGQPDILIIRELGGGERCE